MSDLTSEQVTQMAETIWTASRADEGTISATGANIVADALAPIVAQMLADAWDEGHRTIQRLGPDDCHCSARNESECGCGNYGTNVITPNPYREQR